MKLLPASISEKLQTLRGNIYFEGLDSSALDIVTENMRLYQFKRKETVFLEGEKCVGLHILKSGSAKIYRLSPQGRQYIVNILHEGATFNEVSVYGGGANPVNVETLEKATIWIISVDALRKLVLSYPNYAQKIIENLAGNLRGLVQRVSEMAFFQVTHRLARLLNTLPEESLSGKHSSRLTQDQLAAYLGSVREVIARSLKELERNGAIRVENRRIYIVDQEKLNQLAEGMWE
ncbi:MAG: Crp/Fnr family transcriptional regulator [Anaerolineae bacterium]|jgi:CRP/FNR family transcriptional regulator|nr:Crp/Fnr family transcriptional regulator [Anaerolineae bacterium]MBT3712481.1 Crp/Fnr family transcriptional regulator [Anaerolineae bacterium]MBT4311700.1 Crp/Fnr family transcriptional regulator [Anaerolineae bacterium]MBT4457737.1 Crp/Fnr family transcriptional regulator [Anaerolineae bacterium]MBT6061176.1 Crp/Fnr family transcriptional regulator [Anaerolineae bacterium]